MKSLKEKAMKFKPPSVCLLRAVKETPRRRNLSWLLIVQSREGSMMVAA